PVERSSFIRAIIKVYRLFIGSHKAELNQRPPLYVLEHWTQNAELDIAAGEFVEAFSALEEVAQAFLSSPYLREFSRVARLLFSSADWEADHHKFNGFETVFRAFVKSLSYSGQHIEVDNLLDKYATTFPAKDSRYINYCEMRSFSKWVR